MITERTLDALKELRDRLESRALVEEIVFAEEIEIAEDAIAEAENPYAQRVCRNCLKIEGKHRAVEFEEDPYMHVLKMCPGQRGAFDHIEVFEDEDSEEDSA